MAREPQFVGEYAAEMNTIGSIAFQVKYRGFVLVGVGLVANVSDRPLSWKRRTLGAVGVDEPIASESIRERVWRVRKGEGAQRGAAVMVGQSSDNDIILPEYTVSTQHASFSFDAAGMSITDLGSLNGTKVDGVLIEPLAAIRIKDNQQLIVGRICFNFLSGDSFSALARSRSTVP